MDWPPEESPFLAGTSGWVYEHWKNRFYPGKLPKSKWFSYYITRFPTVEINSTFYRNFKDQTYYKWRDQAPPGFRYVLKAPRLITHLKHLEGVEGLIGEFWRSASLLEDRLGLILLQVAPQTPYDLGRLRKALLAFGDPARVAVEFRSGRWETEETYALLQELEVCTCNPDSPQQRLTGRLTSQAGYLRMHGRSRWYSHNYTEGELQEIAGIMQDMAQHGAKTVYAFFNNDFEGYAPHNASRLLELLKVNGRHHAAR